MPSAASAGIVATNTADGNLEVDLKRVNSSTWRLTFYGREVFLPHLTGWEYIAELMRHPGQDVSAMDLRACLRLHSRSEFGLCKHAFEHFAKYLGDSLYRRVRKLDTDLTCRRRDDAGKLICDTLND